MVQPYLDHSKGKGYRKEQSLPFTDVYNDAEGVYADVLSGEYHNPDTGDKKNNLRPYPKGKRRTKWRK
jgi:hypothetical protein